MVTPDAHLQQRIVDRGIAKGRMLSAVFPVSQPHTPKNVVFESGADRNSIFHMSF